MEEVDKTAAGENDNGVIEDFEVNEVPENVPQPEEKKAPVEKKEENKPIEVKPEAVEEDAEIESAEKEEEKDEDWEEPLPKNLMQSLFWNLDVNNNKVIDVGDLEILLRELDLSSYLTKAAFKDPEDITLEEIGDFLKEFNEEELKKVLFHKKLKFVESFFQQTNEGDIFALYRVFDSLNIDRNHLLVDNDKYLKADASGVSEKRLHTILESLDRKSLLKLLSLEHVVEEETIFTWTTFFRIWKVADVIFWCICVIVCVDAVQSTDGGHLPCRSKIAHMFSAYLAIKGVNYAFEMCLASCSQFFRHPKQFETRYIMSFLPFLSWLFSIVIRHCAVFVALVEVSTTEKDCWKEIKQEEGGLAVFFWWAMVYECVSLGLFVVAWISLPFITLYLLSIAIRPKTDSGMPSSGSEPLTEFCKVQFHKHIRSGDFFYDFILNLTGLTSIVKKNDLARLLVTSSQEQELTKKDVLLWTKYDVFQWLKSINMEKYGKKFTDDEIDGNRLLKHVDILLMRKGLGVKEADAKIIYEKIDELRKPSTVGSWSVNEVCDWLHRIGLSQYADDFRERKIIGPMLINTEEPAPQLVEVLQSVPAYHRVRLLQQMQLLRNEGASFTVGDNFHYAQMNPLSSQLALENNGPNPQYRDIESFTPLVNPESVPAQI